MGGAYIDEVYWGMVVVVAVVTEGVEVALVSAACLLASLLRRDFFLRLPVERASFNSAFSGGSDSLAFSGCVLGTSLGCG